MNTKHKHAEIIKAWADGEQIEMLVDHVADVWIPVAGKGLAWHEHFQYRIKPKPEYPTTLMDNDQLQKLYHTDIVLAQSCKAFANAAIRHAIDSGQVIIAPKGE